MKLYYTPNSPYARICRIALRESGLSNRITEVEAATRDTNSEFFNVTPLARVPALVDGGILVADTRDICAYFDAVCERVIWCPSETENARTYRHIAVGFLDGVAVWLRENARPNGEKSTAVMAYEEHRAHIALAWLEKFQPATDTLNFSTLAITCAIDIARQRGMATDWDAHAPTLLNKVDIALDRPAFRATTPLAP